MAPLPTVSADFFDQILAYCLLPSMAVCFVKAGELCRTKQIRVHIRTVNEPHRASATKEMTICAVCYDNHGPHASMEYLKCGQCDRRIVFSILFNFYPFKFKFV